MKINEYIKMPSISVGTEIVVGGKQFRVKKKTRFGIVLEISNP